MPLDFEISDRAIKDIEAISVYIAKQNRDSLVAERFALRLLDRCFQLKDAPKMGTPYLERPGFRKVNEGAYKIIYQITNTHIVVLRIWDGRRGQAPLI
jgi:plasmid stabilization system protein ParE